MRDLKELMIEVERVRPDGGEWCDLTKCTTLAAIIVSLQPKLIVEIGVWLGGSLIPQLIALKHVGTGRAVAIDSWSADVSVVGETEVNRDWWSKVDHLAAYRKFLARLEVLGLTDICEVRRVASDDTEPPLEIDMLHIDGSHTEQAVRDVRRFATNIVVGGILVMDDCHWIGGGVLRAVDLAIEMGFVHLYGLGTGCVMQRRSLGSVQEKS